jgi:hypothetical protein
VQWDPSAACQFDRFSTLTSRSLVSIARLGQLFPFERRVVRSRLRSRWDGSCNRRSDHLGARKRVSAEFNVFSKVDDQGSERGLPGPPCLPRGHFKKPTRRGMHLRAVKWAEHRRTHGQNTKTGYDSTHYNHRLAVLLPNIEMWRSETMDHSISDSMR